VLKSTEERHKFAEDNPFVDTDEEGEVILIVLNMPCSKQLFQSWNFEAKGDSFFILEFVYLLCIRICKRFLDFVLQTSTANFVKI
jgi:hypothetical protein